MDGLGYVAAVALALVFAMAGLAKLGDSARTARTFRALGLPSWLGVVVPSTELAVALGLLLVPGWSAVVALALLAAFTTFLARAVRSGVRAPCSCFGSAREAPVSGIELARNGALLAVAAVAVGADGPTVPDPGAVAVAVGAAVVMAALLRRADREGPRVGRPAPPLPGIRISAETIVAFVAPGCPRCELDRPALEARPNAHRLELSPETLPTFAAYRVRATPFYVEIDAAGVVRACGPELSDLQSAT